MPASSVARRCISWPAWCRRERIAQPARPCLSIICATPRSALPATTSGYSSGAESADQTGLSLPQSISDAGDGETGRQAEPGGAVRSVSRAEGGRQFKPSYYRICRPVSPYSDCLLPDRHEPDEGEINYPWLYALLDKTGYDGWIGCEYIPGHAFRAGVVLALPEKNKRRFLKNNSLYTC